MFKKIFKLVHLGDPIIVDRWIDVVCGMSWLMLGIFGVFYSFGELTSTVRALTSVDYTLYWGLSIGVLGLLSGSSALSTLVASKIRTRIFKKRLELSFVSVLGGFIAVYPILKSLALFIPPFSYMEVASLAVSLYFMALPTWRVFHLTKRIRALRQVVKDVNLDG